MSARAGVVYLVGAGPGDPGLMTARSLELTGSADAIYYDRLIPPGALEGAREDAELVYVGKAPGQPSVPQEEIGERLIEAARSGKSVVRLKGGDPFVFGRGGEEALMLVERGIPFRVVPGITAGIGALAYAGIPMTHRDVNHTVTFLTGHDQTGLTPTSIDWDAVARGSPVIVMYMAMKHLEEIAAALVRAGRSADEPMAIVCDATTERQAVLETTLGRAAADLAASDLAPPAIVVLGAVVKLRAALDWLGAIAGRKLAADPLGTRGGPDAGMTA